MNKQTMLPHEICRSLRIHFFQPPLESEVSLKTYHAAPSTFPFSHLAFEEMWFEMKMEQDLND